MKIEQQVTSLEISKRLKELGLNKEPCFVWQESPRGVFLTDAMRGYPSDVKTFPAFTVAELGEMLPKSYQFHTYPCIVNGKNVWDCVANRPSFSEESGPFFSDTEADARGKCLIYLLENKLI